MPSHTKEERERRAAEAAYAAASENKPEGRTTRVRTKAAYAAAREEETKSDVSDIKTHNRHVLARKKFAGGESLSPQDIDELEPPFKGGDQNRRTRKWSLSDANIQKLRLMEERKRRLQNRSTKGSPPFKNSEIAQGFRKV